LERLEAEIVELSSQLTAANSRLLLLVAEFDAAEGWREWGMRSTAHWLSWQCGVGLTAGREQVRVARALRSLPLVAAEFAAGRLSYSKVRAVSRVATVQTEATLVEWALHATAAQLGRLVAAQRRVVRAADVRARHDARYLTWRWDDDGSLIGSFRLPPEQAAVLLQALEIAKESLLAVTPSVASSVAARRTLPRKRPSRQRHRDRSTHLFRSPRPFSTPHRTVKGSDINSCCTPPPRGSLATTTTRPRGSRPATASGRTQKQPDDSPATARPAPLTVDEHGTPLHLGRRTRPIRGRLARGGPTCLINLISLCDGHHWLVHDGGWTIAVLRPDVWRFYTPYGRRLDTRRTATPASEPLPTDPTIQPDAVTGLWNAEAHDVRYATSVLNQN
jgi:hypothetical protein